MKFKILRSLQIQPIFLSYFLLHWWKAYLQLFLPQILPLLHILTCIVRSWYQVQWITGISLIMFFLLFHPYGIIMKFSITFLVFGSLFYSLFVCNNSISCNSGFNLPFALSVFFILLIKKIIFYFILLINTV